MQPKGYTGKLLLIDLSRWKYTVKPLEASIYKQFIGGSGLAAYLLWNMVGRDVHPLSPENILVIATGPATGTLAPSSGRFVVASKSPITGIWGESHAGGFFGPEVKYAGYDAIIITGRSSEPVSIVINDDEVMFYKSQHLWGLDTRTTTNAILDNFGRDLHVMVIGPAGENLVKFASIMVDYYRALGRTGMGAVMGSKNLKAIAVRGSKSIEVCNPDEFAKVMEEFLHINTKGPWALPAQLSLGRYGTPNLVSLMNAIGRLPTKNHWTGYWEDAYKISGEALLKYVVSRSSCFSCMIMCKHVTAVSGGRYAGTITGGPEYESIVSLGSNLLIDNIEAIIYMNQLCNLYGLDTISTGKVISFLFECYERGLIGGKELEDLKPVWGSEEAAVKLIKMITYRQGIGNVLAEGVARAAETIGKGAEYYALHIKGLEVSAQDPRAHKSVGVTWATSVRGADHLRSLTTVDELGYRDVAIERFGVGIVEEVCNRLSENYKGVIVKDQEDLFALVDSVIMCKYGTMWPPMYYFDFIARLLYPLTGIEEFSSVKYLRKAAERIVNLKRCFNLREGVGREHETIPKRFTSEPMPTGPAKGHVCNLEPMLREYYLHRRWDYDTGLPYEETLEELDLTQVLVELKKQYSLPRRRDHGSS